MQIEPSRHSKNEEQSPVFTICFPSFDLDSKMEKKEKEEGWGNER